MHPYFNQKGMQKSPVYSLYGILVYYSATRAPKEWGRIRKQGAKLLKSIFLPEIRSLCGQFLEYSHCVLLRRWGLVRALSHNSTISFWDNHSGSCWCFCHEQKATKVNGTHFDDKAGTAKCVFTAIAPGCGAGMTKCEGERWTPLLQPLRAILARAHLLNDSPPPPPPPPPPLLSSPSPPTLHPSAFALHLGLGAMTGPSIISTDWSLLIAIAVNYLDFAEIAHRRGGRPKREGYCRPNKLHITHMKPRPIMKTTAAEAELCRSMKQSRETASSYLVLWQWCDQLSTKSPPPLSSGTLSKDWGDVAWSSRPPGWCERSWLFPWPGWCGHSRGAEWNWLPPFAPLPPSLPLVLL